MAGATIWVPPPAYPTLNPLPEPLTAVKFTVTVQGPDPVTDRIDAVAVPDVETMLT